MTLKVPMSITALLLAAGSAAAHPGERFPLSISNAEERAASRFAAIDSDGDGNLTLAEFEAAEGGDRGMRERPRRQHKRGMGEHGRRAELRAAIDTEVFSLMDTDGDGVISATEHSAADKRTIHRTARKRAMFKHLDKDASGTLQLSELSAPVARLKAADSDGDGMVTRDEMRSHVMAQRDAHSAS